jgi:hypothetical protein
MIHHKDTESTEIGRGFSLIQEVLLNFFISSSCLCDLCDSVVNL